MVDKSNCGAIGVAQRWSMYRATRNCRLILCYIEVDVAGKMTTKRTTALQTFVSFYHTDSSFY
jgi:hypothetical protein